MRSSSERISVEIVKSIQRGDAIFADLSRTNAGRRDRALAPDAPRSVRLAHAGGDVAETVGVEQHLVAADDVLTRELQRCRPPSLA